MTSTTIPRPARGRRATGWFHLVALVATFALVGAACSSDSDDGDGSTDEPTSDDVTGIELTVVSSRPETVTGGDALIEIDGADGELTVAIGDGDATTLETTSDGERTLALVEGLPVGESVITVADGDREGWIEVSNHEITGPVFSGPHQPLVKCTTEQFGLGPATDDDCSAPSTVTYGYYDTDGTLVDLDDPAAVPDDAMTFEVDGAETPMVVRTDTGVLNRGVYLIRHAVTAENPDVPANWNERLVFTYGGGCGTTYSQGFDMTGDPDPEVLAAGYAMASSSLTTFQVTCNDVLSAETTMMIKEYFAETYGPPELTIGQGGSGGAIQQLLIVQNYPGLLDAIGPTVPFPDAITISGGVVDCALLNNFYRTSDGGLAFDDAQRTAINGHLTSRTCDMWEQTFVPGIDPTQCGFGPGINAAAGLLPGLSGGLPLPEESETYDAETNPDGIRCTLQDSGVNIYGTDPDTGFARRAWDNTGVAYGLNAAAEGVITTDMFVELNEGVGSFDIDGVWQPERAEAPTEALEISYQSGRVLGQGGDILNVPIIAVNIYTDDQGDIHDRVRPFAIRERLRNGDGEPSSNMSIWTRPLPPGSTLVDSLGGNVSIGLTVVTLLDEWATAARADDRDIDMATKLADARPDAAVDTCFTAEGEVVESGDGIYDGDGECVSQFPVMGEPRMAAGAPLINDTIKCATQPVADALDAAGITYDDSHLQRLESIFPDGMCDWSQPGIGQTADRQPWVSFG